MHYAVVTNMDAVVYMVAPEEFNKEMKKVERLLTKGPDKPGEPPTWWEGDEEATMSGLAAARAFGFSVDLN